MAQVARPGAAARVLEILWHSEAGWSNNEMGSKGKGHKDKKPEARPVQSIAFHPTEYRACSVGDDRTLKVWEVSPTKAEEFLVGGGGVAAMEAICVCVASESLADICMVAKWSPQGKMIATGSASGSVRIYCRSYDSPPSEGMTEYWKNTNSFGGHVSDITDIAFSPDSAYVISSSMSGAVLIHHLDSVAVASHWSTTDMHRSARAVAWDPWNKLVATYGLSPSLKLCTVVPKTSSHNKLYLAYERKVQAARHVETDTPPAYAISFSPDGVLVAVPNGRSKEGCGRCAYIYARNCIERPVVRLGFTEASQSAVLGCAWAPVFFEPYTLKQGPTSTNERLPWGPYKDYRMALAVWTVDTVVVYTTDCCGRQSFFTDLHVQSITSVSWSHDARYLLVSSLDCYVSILHFADPIGVAHKDLQFVPEPSMCSLLDTALKTIRNSSIEFENKFTRQQTAPANELRVVRKKRRVEPAPVTTPPPTAATPDQQ